MHLPDLQALIQSVQRLDSLLTDEYEALKTQKLDAFEALQQEKMSLLQSLSSSGVVQDPQPTNRPGASGGCLLYTSPSPRD